MWQERFRKEKKDYGPSSLDITEPTGLRALRWAIVPGGALFVGSAALFAIISFLPKPAPTEGISAVTSEVPATPTAVAAIISNTPTPEPQFRQILILSSINPETGEEQEALSYFVKPGDFKNSPKSAVTYWESSKVAISSTPVSQAPQPELYQRVEQWYGNDKEGKAVVEAQGPVKRVVLACIPNTCNIEIKDSDEAKNMTKSLSLSKREYSDAKSRMGLQTLVQDFFTVTKSDGSLERVISKGGFSFAKDTLTVDKPLAVKFTYDGNKLSNFRDPSYVKLAGKDKMPQAIFKLGQGVVSILAEEKEILAIPPKKT